MDIRQLKLTEENYFSVLKDALAVLQNGGIIIFPTETSYGIGADATNPQAVEKLQKYKGQRQNKPFSIAVADKKMAELYVSLTPLAASLYDEYLPGPLTIVSQANPELLAPGVSHIDGSVGVRIPDHEFVLDLVTKLGRPITATSANISNEKQPYQISDITSVLSDAQKSLVDLIINAGKLPPALPTTLIDARGSQLKVIRQGALVFSTTQKTLSESAEQTIELGKQVITRYKSYLGRTPIFITLSGEMGSGKTHFTKGLAEGLGIAQLIKSPSYTLVHEYTFHAQGQDLLFQHVDAWRLESATDLDSLQLEKTLKQNGVVVIEWPQHGSDLISQFKNKAVSIDITFQTPLQDSDNNHLFDPTIENENNSRILTWSVTLPQENRKK